MATTMLAKIAMAVRKDHRSRLVTAGRVSCPLAMSGDVDVDTCLSCPSFKSLKHGEAGKQWLRCTSTWSSRPATYAMTI